jgi:hypothetical protein
MNTFKAVSLAVLIGLSSFGAFAADLLKDDMLLEKIPIGSVIVLKTQICIPKSTWVLPIQKMRTGDDVNLELKYVSVGLRKESEMDVCVPKAGKTEHKLKVTKVTLSQRPASSLRDDTFPSRIVRFEVDDPEIKAILFETGREEVLEELEKTEDSPDGKDIFGVEQDKVKKPTIGDFKKVFLSVEIHSPDKTNSTGSSTNAVK